MLDLKEIINAVRSLRMPANQFAIAGSSVLVAHNIVPFARDVDIVAYGAAWEIVSEGRVIRRAQFGDDVVSFRDGMIEVYSGWSSMGWRAQELVAEADIFDCYRFVKIEPVLESKRRHRRPQDLEHLAFI